MKIQYKYKLAITQTQTKSKSIQETIMATNNQNLNNKQSVSTPIPENTIISLSDPAMVIAVAPAPAPAPAPANKSKQKVCQICFENYNKSTRIHVTCQSCGFEACRQCHSTFILDTTNPLPNCMHCHKEMQREFLVDNFTLKFVSKDWKEHRERVMLQKERALLPTRQPVAEMVKRKNDLAKESNTILEQINALRARHYATITEKTRLEHRIRVGPAADAALPGAAARREHAAFVRPCPNTEANCRGFLSTQWKCNLCDMWTCKDCHEMKGPEQDTPHECNQDNLASAKLIDADTRGCPKCGARVYKISGCNQMFCTACNDCAFDWVTGRVETVIHNPHYYEFQRQLNGGQAPRVIGDILCGREVDNTTIAVVTNLFPVENISRNIIVWRNANKDFINERHVATAVGGGAAGASEQMRIPLSAKDKWYRFYADCLANVNNMMGDNIENKKQQSQQKTNTNTNKNLLSMLIPTPTPTPTPIPNGNRIERMRMERIILFRKLQFQEICRIIIEIRLVLLPQYRVDPLRYNEELGVKYLLGELSDRDFAIALQRSDKRMQKSRDIQNILTMVLNTSTDIIFRFAEHLRQSNANQRPYQEVTDHDFEILDEIRELFIYANRCMNVVARTYQSKVTIILGNTLEPKYWDDDGQVIYTKMTEYNRAVGGGGAAYGNHQRYGNVNIYGNR